MAQAANVTKYGAGGSGDNYVADGYIKTVEKVWLDSYTIAFTNTNTTIDIAVLPANKKITSIELVINTSVSQTSGTISVGFNTDASVNTLLPATTISHNLTTTTVQLPSLGLIQNYVSATVTNGAAVLQSLVVLDGYQKVTGGTQTTVAVKLNNWTMTTGTIKSIVRYT